jgi:glycosyltransferase involved in cell wall biosynthesis
MILSVIIPTYKRVKDVQCCLEALTKQIRLADEVIIVVRDTDVETLEFLESYDDFVLQPIVLKVNIPGVIAAMNLGLECASGDILAFTDDDAAPHIDWLARIEAHFLSNDTVGGVGGRDLMYINDQLIEGQKKVVGKLQWFGRAIGNHHLGIGEPREVDILKGVNMSFRRQAIKGMRFDERLLGTGAQVHFEISFCLNLKRAGWTLIYDPAVAVDHFWGKRFDEDQRFVFNEIAEINKIHNETLILLEHLSGIQKVVYLCWAALIGTRASFGLLQWLRFLPNDNVLATKKLITSWQGHKAGWESWRRFQR